MSKDTLSGKIESGHMYMFHCTYVTGETHIQDDLQHQQLSHFVLGQSLIEVSPWTSGYFASLIELCPRIAVDSTRR